MLNHSQEIEFSPLLPSLSFTAALARGKDVKRRREKERERDLTLISHLLLSLNEDFAAAADNENEERKEGKPLWEIIGFPFSFERNSGSWILRR